MSGNSILNKQDKHKIILSMLQDGKDVQDIAFAIKQTRQGVEHHVKKIIVENHKLIYYDIFFKRIKKGSEEYLKAKLTSMFNSQYDFDGKYLMFKEFKPFGAPKQIAPILKNLLAKEPFILVEKILEILRISKKDQASFIEMLEEVYKENIIIFKGRVISIRRIGILKLVELSAAFSDNIEDMYENFKLNASTAAVLEKNSIQTLRDFRKRINARPLDQKKFIRITGGWEIKSKNNMVDFQKDRIIALSVEVSKLFLCGFHLKILKEAVEKRMNTKIDTSIFEQILIESKNFKHLKGSLIIQADSRNFVSVSCAVKEVIRETPASIAEIVLRLKKIGREMSESSIRVQLSNIKKDKNSTLLVTEEKNKKYFVKSN